MTESRDQGAGPDPSGGRSASDPGTDRSGSDPSGNRSGSDPSSARGRWDGRERREVERIQALLQETLGPEFEVLRSLGRGRMAEVFLAREVELQRLVAVKVLRPDLALQEAPRKRFIREARSAAKISHANVVKVHRVGTLSEGTPYLIMEYVDGRTMDDVLAADGPRPEAEVRTILIQIADALQAAHDQGIIHRDVRPNNIMRDRAGNRFVLTDFGVAGILESGDDTTTRLTGAGEILGHVRYTAPEQLEGNPVRTESDVYALGVTAYELLAREGPYGTDKVADIIQAHLSREPTPISKLRLGTGAEIETLLLRCLAKKPEHRPPAGDIAKRLSGQRPDVTVGNDIDALTQFRQELKRRRVYKVGVAYAAVGFVVLQAAEVTLPAIGPEWLYRMVVLLVLAGFPLALALAWIYDLTATGVTRTGSATPGAEGRGLRALQIAGLVASLLIAGALAWVIL